LKRIGIFGGTSPESTVEYYRRLTREYVRRFGNHGYPEILIHSVSFQRYIDWMQTGDWDALARGVIDGFEALAAGGAEIGLIATNTFHRVFDRVAAASPIPLISLLDVVANRLCELGCTRPVLLGTRFTMSGGFYPDRLHREGIEVLVPEQSDQREINRIIFDELNAGRAEEASRELVLRVAAHQIENGGDSLILGCTELPLLLGPEDVPVPVLDTTVLHADAALAAVLD
jgi:aspartate racemase